MNMMKEFHISMKNNLKIIQIDFINDLLIHCQLI